MTTTPAIIRASIESRIAALTPTVHSGDPFRAHGHEMALPEWALANPSGCARRFSVRFGWPVEAPTVTDGLTEGVSRPFTVLVSYPKSWRRGGGQLVDLDIAIDNDVLQLSSAVGTSGFASLSTTTQAATVETVSSDVSDLGPVVIGILNLRAFYYRSTAP